MQLLRAPMPNDMSLPGVTAVPAASNAASEPRMAGDGLPQPSAEAPKSPLITNPSLRLDAALGLVVIEFRNDSGAITTSIPSQRQLEAYQRWATTQFGPGPFDGSQVRPATSPPGLTEGGIVSHLREHKSQPVEDNR